MARRGKQRRQPAARSAPDAWDLKSSLGAQWRSTSPTIRCFRDTSTQVRYTFDAVKRSLQHSAARTRLEQYFAALHFGRKRHGAAADPKSAVLLGPDITADLTRLAAKVGGEQESRAFAVGCLLYGALLFVAGAAPWALPYFYLAFFATCFPWRIYEFHKQRWTFFLVDFCYWANLATAAFLLFTPANKQLGTAMYALAEGPLAGALIVWQNAWVFGSASHTVSVLIHLLPGLALFAHRYFPAPVLPPQLLQCIWKGDAWREPGPFCPRFRQPDPPAGGAAVGWFWYTAAPLLFYAGWQLVYWFIVQICFRGFIQRNGYDTSYNCLARRAAKTNNIWNRIVRQGSTARRVIMYGALQGSFTILVMIFAIPMQWSFLLALGWQVVKIVFPVYFGSRYQCEKVPRYAVLSVLKQYRQQQEASMLAMPKLAGVHAS